MAWFSGGRRTRSSAGVGHAVLRDLAPDDRLATVIRSAKATVDEMLANAGPYGGALHDDLMDLRLILMAAEVPDDDR